MALTKKTMMHKEEPKEEPKKVDYTIEFSFDDGYIGDMKAAELLEKYGFKGTFYIIIDRVDTEGHLTWDQVKDLDKRGHTIGSHTLSHPQDLKLLYDDQLHVEIQNSKDLLESVLGHNISKFCYPRGRWDERVKDFVVKAGYLHARVTGPVGVTELKDNLTAPGTIHVANRAEYGDTPVLEFAKQTIDRIRKEGGYCNVWGHGKEIEGQNHWGTLEEIIKYARS